MRFEGEREGALDLYYVSERVVKRGLRVSSGGEGIEWEVVVGMGT